MQIPGIAAQHPPAAADPLPKIKGFDAKTQRRKEKRKGYVKSGHQLKKRRLLFHRIVWRSNWSCVNPLFLFRPSLRLCVFASRFFVFQGEFAECFNSLLRTAAWER